MAVTYYLDSDIGDDKNNGTSPDQAWKSLKCVNEVTFNPGDRILLKAGTRYSGQIKPHGSGQQAKPIIIDMYGEGDRPRIDGEGAVRQTLYLYNVEYWEVNNLEITNKGKSRQPRRKGVFIHIRNFGTAHHIHLKNLYVHDVNGGLVKREDAGSGISWRNEGQEKKSRFDDLLLEGCHIVRCERNGITGGGYWGRAQWHPSLNVVIRKNVLEQVPGDGIVPIACDGALVEHNVMRDCPRLLPDGDAAAGIWPWSCDNTVIQFNEVSDHKAPWDAQGFDSDWNCRNTIIQYNYSHDNEGGFLLICNNGKVQMPSSIGNDGTIVRYNISVNDGLRANGKHAGFSPIFHISGPCNNTKIYNNVIYVTKKSDEKIDKKLLKMDNWGGPWPENTWFANNIFYAENTVKWNFGKAINTVFENNLYYGTHNNRPQDACAIFDAPLFVNPDGDTPSDYRLREGSPCIDAGIGIPDNGGHNFFGAHIRAKVSLGQKGILPVLRVSENRRFLVTGDGAPFFYLGDTAWFLFGRTKAEEADLYLQDRTSKGFTVIQAIILYDGGSGLNAYGHNAFIGKYPSKPNEMFFQHVDYVINKAESLGLYMGISPIWAAHYAKEEPPVIGKSDAYTYGKFLGTRYKDKPIIWVLGGDWPGDGMEDVWGSMAQGLAEGDGGAHLITYHPRGGQTSSTWFHDEEWLDFNMIQSGHSIENRNYDKIAADYGLKPVKPVLDGEPGYENITDGLKEAGPDVPKLNAFHVRRYAYCGVFAGAAGHTYGCNEVYQFWVQGLGKPRWGAELQWREAINLPGASQMQYVRYLVESRPMLVRIPDQSMVAGDTMKTGERIQATRGSDGSCAFIYIAAGRPINVHMDRISGRMVKVYWYNPRNGSADLIGEFPNTGIREFAPPSSGAGQDWVLVLDDKLRDFPVPGSSEAKEE